MWYLDYILYIIIIILLCILIRKNINTTEGFEHKGKSFMPPKKKPKSFIKTAQYGSVKSLMAGLENDTTWKGAIDVKPILDDLILSGASSTIVSNITFGGVSDDDEAPDKILLIKFINPNTRPSDAYNNIPPSDGLLAPYGNSWYWRESDSVTLNFDPGDPSPFWFTLTKAFYKIAELMAAMLIQGPYNIITTIVGIPSIIGSSVGSSVNTPNNKKSKIIEPFKYFFTSLWSIIKGIFMKIYGWIKWCFLKLLSVIGDIPSFLTSIFTGIISFITTVVTKTFDLISTIFNALISILKAILQIPLMIFDILDKVISMFLNLIIMLIQLPITILNMTVGFQKIIMDIMTKTPKIPFLDMFFG
jgi:hypothetical protein